MYAIRIPTLEDVPGFPVLIDGHHDAHAKLALGDLNGGILALSVLATCSTLFGQL